MSKNWEANRPPLGNVQIVITRKISIADLSGEPFRIFFPLAVLAGLLGVAIWPLHFAGIFPTYPGTPHIRLMIQGFFGGFIFGFLGTALPRVLSAKTLGGRELGLLACLYVAMVTLHLIGSVPWGDLAFLLLLVAFLIAMGLRFRTRRDLPPPGFVLILMAFGCAAVGAVLSIIRSRFELSLFWFNLEKLLLSQGFVLLPVLGVGAFLLPRFFGLISRHHFQEAFFPPAGWGRQAVVAALAGALIIGTFVVESLGWLRLAHFARLIVGGAYLIQMVQLFRSPKTRNTLGKVLKAALVLLLGGLLLTGLFPAYRVGLLHITLVGGLGMLTFAVATRVVFGHSGFQAQLQAPNRWLVVAVSLMLIGMATRISGDYWPAVLASHYSYGAIIWIAGVMLWAVRVLPKIRFADE